MAKPKLKDRPQPKEIPVDMSFEETSHTEIVPVPKGMLEEDRSMLMQLQETKLQTHLNFARNNPRNIQRSREAMVKMATWDEEIAKSMYYSVPRGGKMVTGESIRFAETIKQAGLRIDPYHVYVPSFGEWGFILAARGSLQPELRLPEGLKYITEASTRDMFHFPPDMGPVQVEPNRLNNQVLVRYFEEEWAHYVH